MPRRTIYLPKDNHKTFLFRLKADTDIVSVPGWFLRKWPHAFTPNVKLQDPAQHIYVADVVRNDLDQILAFILDSVKFSNSLNHQVFIRFQYIRNNFFKIRIYDVNELEINYPAPPITTNKGGPRGRLDAIAHDHHLPAHVHNRRPGVLWRTKLSAASASGKQGLLIPANILINNFTDRPDALKVIVPDGPAQLWNLLWDRKKTNRCLFGKGWYQYCRSAPFVHGDYLWFRVARDHPNTLILTINDVY